MSDLEQIEKLLRENRALRAAAEQLWRALTKVQTDKEVWKQEYNELQEALAQRDRRLAECNKTIYLIYSEADLERRRFVRDREKERRGL